MVRAHLPLLRPQTRGDCADAPRPCLWQDCTYHLVSAHESCVLDVADRGADRTEIAAILGEPLEETRKTLETAMKKLGAALEEPNLRDDEPDEWVSMREASKLLSCSRHNIDRLVAAGRVTRRTDARGVVFSRDDLNRERGERNRSPHALLERMKAVYDRFSSPLFSRCMKRTVMAGDRDMVVKQAEFYMSEQGLSLVGVRIVLVSYQPKMGRAVFNVEPADGVAMGSE